MPSNERGMSRDRDLVKHQHQHSYSETGRLSVPMWDSSDPERAPPPLPLNPGSPGLTLRGNASATIAAAAKALEEKARESAPASAYTINPMPQKLPENALMKGAAHKRMQSLQSPSMREFRSFLDGGVTRSPERSPERPQTSRLSTPNLSKSHDREYLSSPEKSPPRSSSPTPASYDHLKDTPSARPSSRPGPKAILGEHTPPTSATMLALQAMSARDTDPPSSNHNAQSTPRNASTQDALSAQIITLTSICTNLQKELNQLSRRSKDNATDLISLREATSSRDEDIRKSLKELVDNFSAITQSQFLNGASGRSVSGMENVREPRPPFCTPEPRSKSFSLPRIASPASFLFDERMGSPNPYSVEGAASVAMLEKIIREMVTKDGQERLLNTLSQLLEKARDESGETAKKVTELVDFIKSGPHNHSLIQGGGAAPTASDSMDSKSTPTPADFISDEMLSLLRKVKDSVSESGGLTEEIKSLLRDLREEVLDMGRELGRKIDEAELVRGNEFAIDDGNGRDDVVRIVQEGLDDLKDMMDRVIREKRRMSSSDSVISRNTVDSQEVYQVVKHTLAERGLTQAPQYAFPGLDRDAILQAVKEAYEAYKPEIEIEQIGLDRDEILHCLKEGLDEYRSSKAVQEYNAISRDEIMDAVHEAMQDFTPPAPPTEAHEIREEVLAAVKECLEDFKPTTQALIASKDLDGTREILVHAVQEGLAAHGHGGIQEVSLNREVLFEAIKAGLESSGSTFGGYGQQVLDRLQTLVDDMRAEFKDYSSANGRDTEQVLDAMKDGLESLRTELESYVNRSPEITGKDEIIDTIKAGLDQLRVDVREYVSEGPHGDRAFSKGDFLNYIKVEFEHLHEVMSSQMVPSSLDKEEILKALAKGFDGMKSQVAPRDMDGMASDEMQEAMKEEFEQLKQAILDGTGAHKEEILEALQGSLDGIHRKIESSGTNPEEMTNSELLTSVRDELTHLRETLSTALIRDSSGDKEDILDVVRESIDGLRHQILDRGESSKESTNAFKEELENLRESINTVMVRASSSDNHSDLLEALRAGLEVIHSSIQSSKEPGDDEELLLSIRSDIEHLRATLASSLAHHSTRADTQELLDAVRIGLDDLRSHLERKIENPERQMSATNEILDALNEGLETLKNDVAKMVDKPVDMTVSYEILDTLKEGLAGLRAEIDTLKSQREPISDLDAEAPKGNEIVLAEAPERDGSREVSASVSVLDDLSRTDLERMELMLAHIQGKVDAMDENMHQPPPPLASSDYPETSPAAGAVLKEDLAGIEEMLKELQATVDVVASRESEDKSNVVRKGDIEAIETLLLNTKAKIDEFSLPDPETAIRREHIDSVEAAIQTVNDAIAGLAGKFKEDGATKGDVAVVEVLAQDIKTVLDEIKSGRESEAENIERLTKSDVDVLGLLCTEIKSRIESLTLPDPDTIASSADMEQLKGLIHDFRDSHDKLKDSYESDIAITAQAFDDRKQEATELLEQVGTIKTFLEEFRDDLKNRLENSEAIDGLKGSVNSLEETIRANFDINADVKELMETVTREFERAHGSIEGLKVEQDEKSNAHLEKHDEVKAAIIAQVTERLDEKFDAIMTKYDDAQLIADENIKTMKEKAEQQEELVTSSKAMAEDLKVTIDTLGSTLTGLENTVNEAAEKMSSDSQTVFDRIEATSVKINESHTDLKGEHSLTRDEIAKALAAINSLQDDVTEFNPRFMVTLDEIRALLSTQFEQNRKAQEATREKAEAQLRELTEVSRAQVEELKSTFSTTLPALLPPPPPPPAEPVERYDDAALQEKLDRLLNHATGSSTSLEKLQRLDQIHQQVMATAAEVSEFVSKQTALITEGHESKEREAEEVALLLERRLAQKEQVEADIRSLHEEKEALRTEIHAMTNEKNVLLNHKLRLAADVSSLQTALEIRREELHVMDQKADALERRILEGIMDHSRVLLLNRTGHTKPARKSKGTKRTSDVSQTGVSHTSQSAAASGLSLALKSRPRPQRKSAVNNQVDPAARRIMSLSQITGNTTKAPHAYSGAGGVPNTSLKRAHSVKSQFIRKTSWADRRRESMPMSTPHESNKENCGFNEAHDNHNQQDLDDLSDAGTERRRSFGTSHYPESMYAYSVNPSTEGDVRYEVGSYVSGTDYDRRTSHGTMRSALGDDDVIDEEVEIDEGSVRCAENEDEDEGEKTIMCVTGKNEDDHYANDAKKPGVHQEELDDEGSDAGDLVPPPLVGKGSALGPSSDGDLGSDLLSATIEGDPDYFRRAAEEESTVA